ncbi:MAG: tetratricopeptide repeat protein [Desulfobacterales bacterium]|nr:tetratricopeptide repeat protein [Desulfobacterales bacterium]
MWDDHQYVKENAIVKQGLTYRGLIEAFQIAKKDYVYWHPLTTLSHMLDCELFGTNAPAMHIMNVVLHCINAILLFIFLNQITGQFWQSGFVVLLFAVHPLNVETVAWIAERKNLLCTTCWLLSLLFYLRYVQHKNTLHYLIVLFIYCLGLLCKSFIVTLPCVLLMLDYWPLSRIKEINIKQISLIVIEKLPFFLFSLISVKITSVSLVQVTIPFQLIPMSLRISNLLVTYVKYIVNTLFPHNLSVFYPFPQTIPLWQIIGSGFIITSILLYSFLMIKRLWIIPFGVFWFFGTLIPVSGIIQAGLWPEMADRWTYIPNIGLFMVIAWIFPLLFNRMIHNVMLIKVVPILYILELIVISYIQTSYWQNNSTLFNHAINVTKNNYAAHNMIATCLMGEAHYNEAQAHLERAISISPQFQNAYVNLAWIYHRQGRPNEAIELLQKSLQITPNYFPSHHVLAQIYKDLKNDELAMNHYNQALRIDPKSGGVLYNYGAFLLEQGKINEAISLFQQALLYFEGNISDVHYYLGKAYYAINKYSLAILHFEKTIALNPNDVDAHNDLAILLYQIGDRLQAIDHFQKALNLQPKNQNLINNLNRCLQ